MKPSYAKVTLASSTVMSRGLVAEPPRVDVGHTVWINMDQCIGLAVDVATGFTRILAPVLDWRGMPAEILVLETPDNILAQVNV